MAQHVHAGNSEQRIDPLLVEIDSLLVFDQTWQAERPPVDQTKVGTGFDEFLHSPFHGFNLASIQADLHIGKEKFVEIFHWPPGWGCQAFAAIDSDNALFTFQWLARLEDEPRPVNR